VRGDGTRAFYFTEVRGRARARRARLIQRRGVPAPLLPICVGPCNSANTPRSACGPGATETAYGWLMAAASVPQGRPSLPPPVSPVSPSVTAFLAPVTITGLSLNLISS